MSGISRNIELKCRCGSLATVKERAEALGAVEVGLLEQKDTFFRSTLARLKLREFGDGRAELISYRRPDVPEARASDYSICPVADAHHLAGTLAHALGVSAVISKRRRLLRFRNTRIHLDEVEGLGSFVELETVLDGISDDDGHAELATVAQALGLRPEDYVARPYVELR